ncbi:MAG: CAP domain-containing protein [Clostridia bacterium]|nr:CAP domain-containing protein [Clostridia bacterium]
MNKNTGRTIVLLTMLIFVFTISTPVFGATVQGTGNYSQSNQIIAEPGDYGTVVKEIKSMLKAVGYYFGTSSSYYNTTTKYAVKYFQMGNQLRMTGIVDSETYETLKAKYFAKVGVPDTSTPQPEPQPEPEVTPQPKPWVTPQLEPTIEQGSSLSADEQLMLSLINQERVRAGVAPLEIDMRIVQSARVKSKDMIDNNYFSHTSPTLGSFSTLIRNYAPDYLYLGENLAGNRSVEAAHNALMNSEGHRKNILNPNYIHIGIGIVNGGSYGKMFTQHFGG